MKTLIVTAIAVTLFVEAASAKTTTATLVQEYQTVQKRIEEDQQQLLRLEGAIRILEINAQETTSTEKLTSSTKTAK